METNEASKHEEDRRQSAPPRPRHRLNYQPAIGPSYVWTSFLQTLCLGKLFQRVQLGSRSSLTLFFEEKIKRTCNNGLQERELSTDVDGSMQR